MRKRADDWAYIRKRNQHFTAVELDLIATRFRDGVKATAVARELQCSSRNIYIRYAELRGHKLRQLPQRRATPTREKRAPANREARFYRSSFEPS